MTENKKIRGAKKTLFSGIEFKSVLEKKFYKTLRIEGFNVLYEPATFTLWDGFKPVTPFYDMETDKQYKERIEALSKRVPKMLTLKSNKIVGIRYTPDFYFRYKNTDVYIEAKGRENDVFYIKKKLFIKYLDDKLASTGQKSLYFEIYNMYQLKQAINIIKSYG